MSVFIIAEAGSNWRCGTLKRDMQMGRTLIDLAAEAKADAIKFQTYRAKTVYVPNAGTAQYLTEAGSQETITAIFEDLSMNYDMIPELADHCKKQGIEFMSTPFSIQDAEALEPFITRHKIASYEITHRRLIEYVAKTKKPLILSRGGATQDEIAWAIQHFRACGGKDITLMHCIAKYPAPLSSLNLRVLMEIKSRFNVSVGFSDHSRDPIVGPVTAVACGATVVEKHFTLHNLLPGPDHAFAITADELKTMVKRIRECEEVLGSAEIKVQNVEAELRDFAQRGLQAVVNIKKGDLLREGKTFDILRPGKRRRGLHPRFIEKIDGKPAKRDIALGDGIQEGDF